MKNKKWVLFIIGVLIIVNVSFFVYQVFLRDNKVEVKETKILDTIESYNYYLEDRDKALYKDEFNVLKTNLTSDNIDYFDYAKSIAKLYIIDLYTLNNKLNKYDVGGKEFVFSAALDNYILKVQDTLYKYIEDNTYEQRKQDLPVVKSIGITNILETDYIYNDNGFDAYEVTLAWEYEKTNNYDKSAKIVIIKDGSKLNVVEENRVD